MRFIQPVLLCSFASANYFWIELSAWDTSYSHVRLKSKNLDDKCANWVPQESFEASLVCTMLTDDSSVII